MIDDIDQHKRQQSLIPYNTTIPVAAALIHVAAAYQAKNRVTNETSTAVSVDNGEGGATEDITPDFLRNKTSIEYHAGMVYLGGVIL